MQAFEAKLRLIDMLKISLAFSILILLGSCKKDPVEFPSLVTYPEAFSEDFNSAENWTSYVLSFDSAGYPNGHDSVDFSFENGLAEIRAAQDDQCSRHVLDRHLDQHSLILRAIENDTLFVSFTINQIEHIGAGWTAVILTLDEHVISFSLSEIEATTTYTFEISDWEVYNYQVAGDTNATIVTEYTNEAEPLGNNKILLKSEACRGSGYAEARMIFDEITFKTKVTAI